MTGEVHEPVTVGDDGTVTIGGLRYWSEASVHFAGRAVRVEFPLEHHDYAQLWTRGRTQYLARMAPIGAANIPNGNGTEERVIAARVTGFRRGWDAAHRRSIVGLEVESVADCIRVALQLLRRDGKALLADGIHKIVGLFRGFRGRARHRILGREDVGEHQVLQGFDTVEQRGVHQTSPTADGEGQSDEERIAARVAAHRLSESQK